ncbi:hypothetical protein M378DRAFT_182468 [Amanita muscaria Koide BX008]|uniref:Uncharacterized protein n=1 Tax=Amanita muscaria (strain Koide BX008) TaxID=946122 RepID=A0A0C2RWI7_AMAMK|nr:hypothetical protein M378DRAFT_182468 [Amanita muscaria Koide BX008]
MQQEDLTPTVMSLEENLATLSVEQAYTIRVYNGVRVINGRIHTGYHELEFADKESDDQSDNQCPHEEDCIRKRRVAALAQAARKKRFDRGPVELYSSDSDGEEPEELSDIENARRTDPVWFERVKKNTEAYIVKREAIEHQRTPAN